MEPGDVLVMSKARRAQNAGAVGAPRRPRPDRPAARGGVRGRVGRTMRPGRSAGCGRGAQCRHREALRNVRRSPGCALPCSPPAAASAAGLWLRSPTREAASIRPRWDRRALAFGSASGRDCPTLAARGGLFSAGPVLSPACRRIRRPDQRPRLGVPCLAPAGHWSVPHPFLKGISPFRGIPLKGIAPA